ncbi:MAG: hypothetical protein PHY48_15485 [Candidatus Cloacimonetes bacterium]|nr:hypothetical protein [Candidatus Cloacimonadota bacterium]
MSDMVIRITLDAAQLKKELGLTDEQLKKVDGRQIDVKTENAQSGIAKLRDSVAKWGLAVNAAITAAKSLAGAINSVVAPAMVQEKAEQDLAAALKNTGIYSAQLESQLKAQASAIQSVTTYGDESILMATRQMQVIGQLSADQLPAAQKAAVGLAAAYKLDLNTAFEMVGKAAAGNTATLSRYGIVLEEGLDPQEKFAELLRVGADRFALARDEANTTSGALQQMNNLWGDLKEVIGTWILPMLGDVAAAFSDVLKLIQGVSNHEKSAQKQTEALAWQFDFLTNKVLEYKSQTSLSAQEQEEFNGYLKELQQAFPDHFTGMDMLTMKYDDVATAIAGARGEVELLMDRMLLQAVMDDYSDDLIKYSKKIRLAQEELQKYQKMQEEGDEWVVVGPDMIRSVKMYINMYNDEIERFRKKKASIIAERDALAEELSVLPEPPTPSPPKEPNAGGAGTGSGSGSSASTAEAAKAEISETAKAYAELLQQLQKYHDERALIGLTAHQQKLANLSTQFDEEQQVILNSLAAKEITDEEAHQRLTTIRTKYDDQIIAAQIAADAEIIELAKERMDRAVQDEESYYETMKFASADYYEWKKAQIRAEVEAMAIGDAEKLELIKQHIAELDALKEEYSSTGPETKSNWFFSGLLGFDPDDPADMSKLSVLQDSFRSIGNMVSSSLSGQIQLNRQRKTEELQRIDETAARERWSAEMVAAAKAEVEAKYLPKEKKYKEIQKAMSIAQATINVAEGVTKALTLGPILGPIMAGIISAMGAVQIGIIKAQKFAFGGLVKGPGGPKDDKIPAMLSNGEYVVNAAATKKYHPILDAINFGKSMSVQPKSTYADGGLVAAGSGSDVTSKLEQIIKKIDILNINLVRKDMKPVIQISSDLREIIRVQDNIRNRMEDGGYVPGSA